MYREFDHYLHLMLRLRIIGVVPFFPSCAFIGLAGTPLLPFLLCVCVCFVVVVVVVVVVEDHKF